MMCGLSLPPGNRTTRQRKNFPKSAIPMFERIKTPNNNQLINSSYAFKFYLL